jgi:hypothetical protein
MENPKNINFIVQTVNQIHLERDLLKEKRYEHFEEEEKCQHEENITLLKMATIISNNLIQNENLDPSTSHLITANTVRQIRERMKYVRY